MNLKVSRSESGDVRFLRLYCREEGCAFQAAHKQKRPYSDAQIVALGDHRCPQKAKARKVKR